MNRRLSDFFLGGVLVILMSACQSAKIPDGEGGSPNVSPTADCSDNSECNDGVFCNGEEECVLGQCRRGAQLGCSDGIACTSDRCDESARRCVSTPPDLDGDGHVDAACSDKEGVPLGDDCDDGDARRFPGATEYCDADNLDEDCNPGTLGFRDADNDTFIDDACCNEQAEGKLVCGDDCNDNAAHVSPLAQEVCDFFDNDCDGKVDDGVKTTRYHDRDHDGHGDSEGASVQTCPSAVGFASTRSDCDDNDPEVFVGQFEICDGKDNNCNGQKDEIEEQAPWYVDNDQDGYGDPESAPVFSCYRIAGRVLSQNDCADENKKVNPAATETCDGQDNDCNGLSDFAIGVNDFEDDDGDKEPDSACGGDDCNDEDSRTAAGIEETCDHLDNDCDGEVDEQTTQTIWYVDEDGDGWGVVIGSALASCDPLPHRARAFGDCNDSENSVHPGTTEYCDNQDNDCDGEVDEDASAFCKLENAITTCNKGTCRIFTCQPGYADSNNDPEDGCEATATPEPTESALTCTNAASCDDFDLCNGIETCLDGVCHKGAPILCEGSPTVLNGDITVQGPKDILDLEGIEFITGSLVIENSSLSSLVGLERLKRIGKNLVVRSNAKLKRLSGSALSNLEFVGGNVSIEANSVLESADLPSLVRAREIYIYNNPLLETLSGYAALETVESIRIEGNANLTDVSAFSSLERIGGQDATCGECSVCGGIGGFAATSNPLLTDFSGLQGVTEIRGSLCVREFAGADFTWPNLEKAGAVVFSSAPAYSVGDGTEVVSFPSLTTTERLRLETRDSGGEYSFPDALREISFPVLENATELNLLLYGGVLELQDFGALKTSSLLYAYYEASPQLKEITFPSLDTCDSVQLSGRISALETLAFPELRRATETTLSPRVVVAVDGLGGNALTSVSFAKLPKAEIVNVSLTPFDGTTSLGGLKRIDFSALTQVNQGLTVRAPFGPLNAGEGLLLPKLSQIGPTNSNYLELCTGSYDPQNQSYISAACSLVATLKSQGYSGSENTCGQCGPQTSTIACPGGDCGNGIFARQFDSQGGDESGESVAVDAVGDVYVAGYTTGLLGTSYFGGGSDGYVRKIRRTAGGDQVVWTTQFGTPGTEIITSVVAQGGIDGGLVYVGGCTSSSYSGDLNGIRDFYLAQLNVTDGSINWTRTFGTSGTDNEHDCINDLALIPGGGVYFAGFTEGNFNGGTNAGPYLGYTDAVVGEMNAQGVLAGSSQFGASGHDSALGVAYDSQSTLVYAAGVTAGSLFGPSSGGDDAFLAYFSEGVGGYQFGTALADRAVSVRMDSNFVPIVAGVAGTGIAPGSNLTSQVMFLSRGDPGAAGAIYFEQAALGLAAMDLDQTDAAFLTTYVNTPTQGNDVAVYRVDPNGMVGVASFGTTGSDEPKDLVTTSSGGGLLYVSGYTRGGFDQLSQGVDAFLANMPTTVGYPGGL